MWSVVLLKKELDGERAGDWFHFWDRAVYSEPQFGDAYGAKRYKSKAGAASRAAHLRRVGYHVNVVPAPL